MVIREKRRYLVMRDVSTTKYYQTNEFIQINVTNPRGRNHIGVGQGRVVMREVHSIIIRNKNIINDVKKGIY